MLKYVRWMRVECLPKYIVGSVRFAGATSGSGSGSKSSKPEPSDKDKDKDKEEGANKSLSGGGYAKRSDEEGFGALYGGNQSLSKDDEDKIVHANVPEYDRSKKK